MNEGKAFAGIILITIGLLFLLKFMGIVSFSVFHALRAYWPVLLIIIGIAMILRVRWFGLIVFVLIMLLVSSYFSEFAANVGMEREIIKEIPNDGINALDFRVSYGAGVATVEAGKTSNVFSYNITTTDAKDPTITYDKSGSTAMIDIQKNWEFLFPGGKDTWDFKISPDVNTTMTINHGAGDMAIDMRNLKVNSLDVSSGASKDSIIFGNYPTKATIKTGASSIDLKFPLNSRVKIAVESGATGINLNGFTKEGDSYYTSSYDAAKQNIEVDIHAGASSITGEFY